MLLHTHSQSIHAHIQAVHPAAVAAPRTSQMLLILAKSASRLLLPFIRTVVSVQTVVMLPSLGHKA